MVENQVMDYQRHYDALIKRARYRKAVGYVERHHVVPRCLGGGDEPSNLVPLTPEEHFVAHQLLVRIHPDDQSLVFAAWAMTHGRNGQNKRYGWLRRKHASAISTRLSGIKRGPFTDEHIRKLSEAKAGRTLDDQHKQKIAISVAAHARTYAARQKVSAVHRGAKRSDETRARISQALAGKPKSAEHAAKSAAAQRGKAQPVVVCPHCGKQGGKPIMARYHFDNCKEATDGQNV